MILQVNNQRQIIPVLSKMNYSIAYRRKNFTAKQIYQKLPKTKLKNEMRLNILGKVFVH